MFPILKIRNFWIVLAIDVSLVTAAYYLAYLARFEGEIPADQLHYFFQTLVWILPVKLFAFMVFDLYRGMYRYTSLHDLVSLFKACVTSSAFILIVVLGAYGFRGLSRGVFAIDFGLTILLIGGFRVSIRLYYMRNLADALGFRLMAKVGRDYRRLLIIGAGGCGEKLLRELQEKPRLKYHTVGFVDDDPNKLRRTIHGVGVLGPLSDLKEIATATDAQEIVIAIGTARAQNMRRVVEACRETGLPFKTIPAMDEVMEGRVSVSAVRDVQYADLLGRESVCLNASQIGGYLAGKRVLVTGGAGSIGSELCRQIAGFCPESLIIVEKNESGLYECEFDLRSGNNGLKTAAILAPVQNRERMEQVFGHLKPQVVFHAAAYKHVPMMEEHPWEAVFNNIVGTRTVLEACERFGVERCVIVSTDKAVRPTNVMGASKRVGELIMQAHADQSPVKFMSVRFGNVVGSIGSVVPMFKKQIEAGGPVTVTHPEMTRYFMTIPEACSLILQAGAIGRGGEIFVLKMGTPVRIDDMARDLIRLSGYRPGEEIEIKYTGLRPGEKLYEELITADEDVVPTEHGDIMILKANSKQPLEVMRNHVNELIYLALGNDIYGIKAKLREIVPEYKPWIPPVIKKVEEGVVGGRLSVGGERQWAGKDSGR